MAARALVGHWSYQVAPVRVYLVQARYADVAGPHEEPEPLDAQEAVYGIGIQVFRPAPLRLTVLLTFATEPGDPVDVTVSYGADFEMHERVPEEERDREWREVALHIAPGLLYPYVREMVSTLSDRGRGPALVLPLIPLPLALEDEDEFEIPPPHSSGDEQELGSSRKEGVPGTSAKRAGRRRGKQTRPPAGDSRS